MIKNLCVFCGSSVGTDPVFSEKAIEMGKLLAARDIRLVYGAGNVGLMGVIADAVLEGGGKVTGVIPDFLKAKEVCHTDLDELYVTETMHQRKAILSDLSDAFVAMPGGFGTLDELAEILTWAQLGLHGKPIGLLNVDGYFDHLIKMSDYMTEKGFVRPQNRRMLLVEDTPEALMESLEAYKPEDVVKWLNREGL